MRDGEKRHKTKQQEINHNTRRTEMQSEEKGRKDRVFTERKGEQEENESNWQATIEKDKRKTGEGWG